ncbi:MAG TPA: FdtA/QdtA family cupin domain-containing protein [Cytophagaceae bacterium]|jgi:dTDP-4-dehydrorhamnose 3,5-epimerase-like enzyme
MINLPHIINLPKILDPRGNLSFFEGNNQIPFEIKRTYLISDVPGGQKRGGHAYIKQEEFIVCLSGSFDVLLHNGIEESIYPLNRSYYGLYIPFRIWRGMQNFSTNSVALVCSSTYYNPNDYIRDFQTFKTLVNGS